MLNTYEQMQNLVAAKLATVKTDGIFDTFKYSRKVMYENLWQKHPETMECRGHVYDNRYGNLVQAAPTKSFNYLENGWWKNVPLDTEVTLYKKFNGFMAAATIYEGELVVSTTGTTNSDFAKIARSYIEKLENRQCVFQSTTTLFEIVDESDPHIVQEEFGCKVLGVRFKTERGIWVPVSISSDRYSMQLGEALEFVKQDRGEGFMCYDEEGNCCKLKTPYYVGKKILMRMQPKNVELMYNGFIPDRLPKEFIPVVHGIKAVYTKDQWIQRDAQARRQVIEKLI